MPTSELSNNLFLVSMLTKLVGIVNFKGSSSTKICSSEDAKTKISLKLGPKKILDALLPPKIHSILTRQQYKSFDLTCDLSAHNARVYQSSSLRQI